MNIIKSIRNNSTSYDIGHLNDQYRELLLRGRPGIYFFVMTMCSATITTMGFIMNSPSVIIGAMVLSPLLYPVVLAGSAIAQKDWRETAKLIKILGYGAIVVLLLSAIVAFIIPFEYKSEVQERLTSSPLQYGIVAVVSGIAGAFAYYWPKVSEVVTGVGISVALMPPFVMVGVAIGNSDTGLMTKSALIVFINVAGIVLGSILGYIGIRKNASN